MLRFALHAGLVAAVVVVLLARTGVAFAGTPGVDVLAAATIGQVVANIQAWLIGLLASVATLFLVVGGVRYVAAGGDPSEVERAKSALKSAGYGYALALLAPVLVTLIAQWVGA